MELRAGKEHLLASVIAGEPTHKMGPVERSRRKVAKRLPERTLQVACEHGHIDPEVIRKFANHLPTECLLPSEHFGDG